MSGQEENYHEIFSYLRSLHFHFLDTWVIECVNYYKSVNPNISLEALKAEVKQQWLLVNLREIKVPCFPPSLKSKHKVMLNGKYAVQVESMIDSSVSCYSQFQKLLNSDLEEIESTAKTKDQKVRTRNNRCLTFVICDGVQEIQAMEYQPIMKIKTNDPELLPGFKMVILGPVECRKGMILLKDENVKIYGGEVDSLTVSNGLKRILIQRLELDESEYSESLANVEFKNGNSENPTCPKPNNLVDESLESLLSQNDDVFLSLPLDTEIPVQVIQPASVVNSIQEVVTNTNKNTSVCNENEINQNNQRLNKKKHSLPEEEIETPNLKRLSLDLEIINEPGPSRTQDSSNVDYNRDIFIDDFDEPCPMITIDDDHTSKPKIQVQTKLSSFFTNETNVQKTSNTQGKPVVVNCKPFVYLKQVMSIELPKVNVFTFKAVILTLKKKITIENDQFNLKANITDGSSSLDVHFCSEILEKLLGFSPCEMIAMQKAKLTNSAIAQRIKESFLRTQLKLISLNCLMDIKFFTDGRTPVVLSLTDVTAQHLRALKERTLVLNN